MADTSRELIPPEEDTNGGSMLVILTQDGLETADTPAVGGSKIPVLDLDTFSQDELLQLAGVCTGLDFDHIRTQELVDPKLDRKHFNESLGSRKQTYSTSKGQRLRRDGEADTGRAAPLESFRAPGSRVPAASDSFVRESSPPIRRRGRPPRPPSITDVRPRPLVQGSDVEQGIEVAASIEDKDQEDIISEEDGERTTRKRSGLPEASGVEADVFQWEKHTKKMKTADEKAESPEDQSRIRKGKPSDTSEAKLFEYLKNMVGRWTSEHRRRKIVAANGFPSGWTVCVGLRQKHGRYYFEYRDYTDPEGKTWSSFKEAAAHLVTVAEQNLMSAGKDSISDKDPELVSSVTPHEQHETRKESFTVTPSLIGDNEEAGELPPAGDGSETKEHEVAFGDLHLGVAPCTSIEKIDSQCTQDVIGGAANNRESGNFCGIEILRNLGAGERKAAQTRFHLRCPVCREEFQTEQKLRAHVIRFCHMLTFACDICGQRFLSKSLLLRHRYKKNHSRLPTKGCGVAMEDSASVPVSPDGVPITTKVGASLGISAVERLTGASVGGITPVYGKELGKQWDMYPGEISSPVGHKHDPNVLQQAEIGNLLCPQWPRTESFATCRATPGAEEDTQLLPAELVADNDREQVNDLTGRSLNPKAEDMSQTGCDRGQDAALLQQSQAQSRTRTRSASRDSCLPVPEGIKRINPKKSKDLRDLAVNGTISSAEHFSENLQADESHPSSGAAGRFWCFLRDLPSKALRHSAAGGLPQEVPTSVNNVEEQGMKTGGMETVPRKAFSLGRGKPYVTHQHSQTSPALPLVCSSQTCSPSTRGANQGTCAPGNRY